MRNLIHKLDRTRVTAGREMRAIVIFGSKVRLWRYVRRPVFRQVGTAVRSRVSVGVGNEIAEKAFDA